MDLYHIFLYGLIFFGFWVAVCLLVSVFSKKNRSTAANASIFPILIFFLLIAMMIPATDQALHQRRRKQRWLAFAIVCLAAALLYWHTAVWSALHSLFGGA